MNGVSVTLITQSSELPQMVCHDYFHSTSFFKILEKTPGTSPCMAVAQNADGDVVAHILAIIGHRRSLLPPFIFKYGHVYGEGEYSDAANKDSLFNLLLAKITQKFKHELCLYSEFSDLSSKMFGYRSFRRNGYFPIPWQEIHNSLHSMKPELRLSKRMRKNISKAKEQGVQTRPCQNEDELCRYISLLRKYFKFKSRRYVPHDNLFKLSMNDGNGTNLITLYKDKIIGGCTLIFSEGNAFLWFMASRRVRYAQFHPTTVTVWSALKYAYDRGCRHLYFLDAGLPFRKNPYREFILSFGGKPVAKLRWFRFPFAWLNRMLAWMYNE